MRSSGKGREEFGDLNTDAYVFVLLGAEWIVTMNVIKGAYVFVLLNVDSLLLMKVMAMWNVLM